MLPPILNSIKEQLAAKEGQRTQSENDFLNELTYVCRLLEDTKPSPKVIRAKKSETLAEDSRPGGV